VSNLFMPRHRLHNRCHTHTLAPHRCTYPIHHDFISTTTHHHLLHLSPPPQSTTSILFLPHHIQAPHSSPSMDALNIHTTVMNSHTPTLCPKVTPSLTLQGIYACNLRNLAGIGESRYDRFFAWETRKEKGIFAMSLI